MNQLKLPFGGQSPAAGNFVKRRSKGCQNKSNDQYSKNVILHTPHCKKLLLFAKGHNCVLLDSAGIFENNERHMSTSLTINDIDESVRSQVYTQQYGAKPTIEGVAILPVKHIVTEDGDFSELLRLSDAGEFSQIPGFFVRQVNRSLLYSGAIKGWHLHVNQDEFWYVTAQSHLLLGLWDIRKGSKTMGISQRVVMGGGKEILVYIPHGVAHGCANVSKKPATVIYFANATFNKDNPDEQRLPCDALGADFWKPQRD